MGADGKRNSIPGFQRKEFRAKLAIGIRHCFNYLGYLTDLLTNTTFTCTAKFS